MKKIIVIDVETAGLSARPESFVFGCALGDEIKEVFFDVTKFRVWLENLSNEYIVFAHNAEYDYTTIFDNIINIDTKPIFSKSNLISFKNKNGCVFADSLNLIKGTVKQIGEQLGIPKLSLDTKFVEGKNNINVTKKDIVYCFRDCEIIYRALQKMFEITGIQKTTIASLSYAVYINEFSPYRWVTDSLSQYHYRMSYYGARTEVFMRGTFKPPLYVYDVNSMYPYIMKNISFPNPIYKNVIKNISLTELKTIMAEYEGCAEIEFKHKNIPVGFFPVKHNGKLLFPTGKIKGVYCFPEIRFGLEKNIINITKINFVNFSYRIESPFKEFVEKYYKLRQESKGYEKVVYKSILNNLYGKFAQGKMENREYFKRQDELFKLERYRGNEVRYSRNGKIGYTITKQSFYPTITAPQFSSYVTSAARVFILSKLLELLKMNIKVAYMDTDSFFVNKNIYPESNELGAFKLEGYRVNKIYNLKDYEISGVRKTKGIKKSAVKTKNNIYIQKQMIKFKSSLTRGIPPGTFVDVKKELKNKEFKRKFYSDKKSIPIYLDMCKK